MTDCYTERKQSGGSLWTCGIPARDGDPHEQFAEWGLELKEVEDTI